MGKQIEPKYREYLERRRIPKKRFGKPEELVDVVLFLASPRSSYVNGAVIPVDGGYLTS
jgi:NAD(P)-dependent dehydrogenase (short-subunit alcohol dehydrogenase family)